MKLSRYIPILPQPCDSSCGPTSLHAVYNFFHHHTELKEIIDSVHFLEEGGTLGVMLGLDAIRRGFEATIYTYNLRVFDPSWNELTNGEIIDRLEAQLKYKSGKKFTEETLAFQEFLKTGGQLRFDDLTPLLLKRWFDRDTPILAGLSATYLYKSMREYTTKRKQSVFHDLRGEPAGHFVVLCGIDKRNVYVADPYKENPLSPSQYYKVDVQRLINAIMLGIVTYDANLLIITPAENENR